MLFYKVFMPRKINMGKETRGRARQAIGPVPVTKHIPIKRRAILNRLQMQEAKKEIRDALS